MVRGVMLMAVVVVVVCLAAQSEARYLPTRADDTRLDEIRELLRELLEQANGSAAVRSGYEKRFMFKRSALGADSMALSPAAVGEIEAMPLQSRYNLRA